MFYLRIKGHTLYKNAPKIIIQNFWIEYCLKYHIQFNNHNEKMYNRIPQAWQYKKKFCIVLFFN